VFEFEFARDLINGEKLGAWLATDLLVVGVSADDLLGHEVVTGSPQLEAMVLASDRQLAGFFDFLKHRLGLANVWLALSADHGIAPLPTVASKLRIPAANLSAAQMRTQVNQWLSDKLSPGHTAEYVKSFDYPIAWLDQDLFAAININEKDAEQNVGEGLLNIGLRGYYTRAQLARGDIPNTEVGLRYLHSYSPHGGWYVMGVPAPFTVGIPEGT